MMILQLAVSMGLLHLPGAFLGFVFKNSLYSGVFTMLASLIIVPLVSLCTARTLPDDVERLFSCYAPAK